MDNDFVVLALVTTAFLLATYLLWRGLRWVMGKILPRWSKLIAMMATPAVLGFALALLVHHSVQFSELAPMEQPYIPPNALPAFPWPPPKPSARAQFECFPHHVSHESEQPLGLVDDYLTEALSQVGHVELAYFEIPKGFAMATRLEQTDALGRSLPERVRWLNGVHYEYESLGDFLRAIFIPVKGYFRIVVLLVTDRGFSVREEVDRDEASEWMSLGHHKLPKHLKEKHISPEHYCSLMIYEFQVQDTSRVTAASVPSKIGLRAHLSGTGLDTLYIY